MFALSCDIQGVELTLRSFDRSNDLSIKFLPVSDFSIRTNSQNLILFSIEKGLFEGRSLEHAQKTRVFFKVPYNAWTIATSRNCLGIVFADLDWPDSTPMFFEWDFHDLSLFCDSPNTNLSFSTSWNYPLAIWSWGNCSASMVVSVIDDIQEFARLRKENSNLTIWPTWNDTFTIMSKRNWEALKPWNLNSKQFLPVFRIPYPNLVGSCSCKHLRVVMRKGYVVDTFIVAGISKFRYKSSRVDPVNVWLGTSCKEMGVISCERNRSDVAH